MESAGTGDRFVGSSARHHELGPIALALVKRNVPLDASLTADGLVAAQEVIVDPEVGLHMRPKLKQCRQSESLGDCDRRHYFRRAARTRPEGARPPTAAGDGAQRGGYGTAARTPAPTRAAP